MLKQQITRQKTLDLKDYVKVYAQNIRPYEKSTVEKIIFHGKPKIKCINVNHNFLVNADFRIVSQAIIKISWITSEFKMYTFTDPTSIHLKNHMMFIHNTLKDGLYNESRDADKLISLAQQVMAL